MTCISAHIVWLGYIFEKELVMKKFKPIQKLFLFLYAVAVLLFCHHLIIRPIFLDWGSPESIQKLALSGDALTGESGTRHTRAVLIEATPEELWPWLIQVGQDRGGFYSHEWLENLFRADMKNVYEIKPEFQWPRMQGDTIWLANKDHYQGQGYQIVAESIPFQSLVMVGGEDYQRIQNGENASGSWAFYLYPESSSRTWLIARSSSGDIPVANHVLRYFTYEVPHFIMERKMLKSMKYLAEK
jgi:hypothetical protein